MKPLNEEEIGILSEIMVQKRLSLQKLDVVKLLKKRDSERMKFFTKIAFTADKIGIPKDRLKELIKLKVLDFVSESRGDMCITAKGILILKYNIMNPQRSVNDLLDNLNRAFYEDLLRKVKDTLTFEEKCTIITLLGLLSFTKKYSVSIALLREREDDVSINKSFAKAGVFLSSILGVENSLAEKLSESGTEGKGVVTLLRRLDDIQLKTEHVYVKSEGCHYLDIISDQGVDAGKLSFLLRRVFDYRPLNFEERKNLVALLKEIEENRISILGNSTDFNPNNIKSDLSFHIMNYTA